jgi:hypothetical protein
MIDYFRFLDSCLNRSGKCVKWLFLRRRAIVAKPAGKTASKPAAKSSAKAKPKA